MSTLIQVYPFHIAFTLLHDNAMLTMCERPLFLIMQFIVWGVSRRGFGRSRVAVITSKGLIELQCFVCCCKAFKHGKAPPSCCSYVHADGHHLSKHSHVCHDVGASLLNQVFAAQGVCLMHLREAGATIQAARHTLYRDRAMYMYLFDMSWHEETHVDVGFSAAATPDARFMIRRSWTRKLE